MALPFEKQQQEDIKTFANEIVRRINEYSRRIKNLEQRVERIDSTVETLQQTALNQMNDLKINLERIGQKIASISDRLTGIENEILKVNRDLGKTALKSDVKKLEMFIDLVNPITAKFVTKDELERAFEEKLKRKA